MFKGTPFTIWVVNNFMAVINEARWHAFSNCVQLIAQITVLGIQRTETILILILVYFKLFYFTGNRNGILPRKLKKSITTVRVSARFYLVHQQNKIICRQTYITYAYIIYGLYTHYAWKSIIDKQLSHFSQLIIATPIRCKFSIIIKLLWKNELTNWHNLLSGFSQLGSTFPILLSTTYCISCRLDCYVWYL